MLTEPQRGELAAAFAKTITEFRENKSLSKNALAERSGVSRTMIIQVESEARIPTVDTLFRLAEALGVRPGQLVDEAWNRAGV